MITLGISEVRSKLPQIVDEVDEKLSQLFITKNGRAKAVIMSADEYESWVETIASYNDPETMRRHRELKNLKRKDLITLEELKRRLGDD